MQVWMELCKHYNEMHGQQNIQLCCSYLTENTIWSHVLILVNTLQVRELVIK